MSTMHKSLNRRIAVCCAVVVIHACALQRQSVADDQVVCVEFEAVDTIVDFRITDTLQRRDDGQLYEVGAVRDSTDYLITLHDGGAIESIAVSRAGVRNGLIKVYKRSGELSDIIMTGDPGSFGFALEIDRGKIIGYSENRGIGCNRGKGYGFAYKGGVSYSSYSDCDGSTMVETVYDWQTRRPRIRTVIVDDSSRTLSADDVGFDGLRHPEYDGYEEVWPDTAMARER